MLTRVLDHQGFVRPQRVLAERVADRHLTPAGRRLAEPYAALEELPVLVYEAHERHGHIQHPAGQASQPVERRFGGGVEEPQLPQCGKTIWIGEGRSGLGG